MLSGGGGGGEGALSVCHDKGVKNMKTMGGKGI